MLLAFLSFLNTVSIYLSNCADQAKNALRIWLGPAPQNYYLLADGRVIPASIPLPAQESQSAHLFEVQSNRISSAASPNPVGRFRPIPFVSATVDHSVYGITDLSDWIGELRANPVPQNLGILQLLQLYSVVHNVFVPIRGVAINVVKNDGEEETIRID